MNPYDGAVPRAGDRVTWRRQPRFPSPPVAVVRKDMTATIDLAIRMRRAAFNAALANADLAAIGPLLAPNAVLVTGTDSAGTLRSQGRSSSHGNASLRHRSARSMSARLTP